MEKNQIVKLLKDLAQLDIDAWHAYGQAMEKMETHLDMRDKLGKFRADHHRHATDLSAKIRELEGEPPEFSKDFKGHLVAGFTALRSITGDQGALAAMRTNEELTNRTYAKALEEQGLPSDIRPLLSANYADEQEHLRYIEDRLDFLVREKGGASRGERF
ncbi:MAG: ferritin-like domain-containing protein [Desulfuromonadales bacterium]|nr:ferritin-like domain-containing protein [Desulfuromonadales bacterium]